MKWFLSLPIIRYLIQFLKSIPLSKNTFSLYDLFELHISGPIRGTPTHKANAIVYSFSLTILPFLLSILNFIPCILIDHSQVDSWVSTGGFLPPGTHRFLSDIFSDIAEKRRGSLLSSVFFLSVFLMTNGIMVIFGGSELSHHIQLTRTYAKQYLYVLMVVIILSLLVLPVVIIFMGYEIYLVLYLEKINFLTDNETLLKVSKLGFVAVITYIATSILLYSGTIGGRENKFLPVGSTFTTTLFGVTTYLFGIYIENFPQYNQLYGSIGVLLISLLYIWINSNILLLGLELSATLLKLKKD